MKEQRNDWVCVICEKKNLSNEDIVCDLSNFNSAICKKCEGTTEANELLGLE